MVRLPTPGGDNGDWGNILNAFLEISHAADGTLNNNVVGTNQIQDAAVGSSQISYGAIGTDQIADGAITNAKLDSPTQQAITKANSAVPSSQLGAANGVATLDSNSMLTADQLPSSVVSASQAGSSGGPAPDASNWVPNPTGDGGWVWAAPSGGGWNVVEATDDYTAVADDFVVITNTPTIGPAYDVSVVEGSPIINAPDGDFTNALVGRVIDDQDDWAYFPAGTTVLSVQSATQMTLSANATGTTDSDQFQLGVTITLPAPTADAMIAVKFASVNYGGGVTLVPASGLIDGNASYQMLPPPYAQFGQGSVVLVGDGTNWQSESVPPTPSPAAPLWTEGANDQGLQALNGTASGPYPGALAAGVSYDARVDAQALGAASVALMGGVASGTGAISLGGYSTASGDGAVALGGSEASGRNALAVGAGFGGGGYAQASGPASFAMGQGNVQSAASGQGAFAFSGGVASGDYSTAIGVDTAAVGGSSHAEGLATVAIAQESHAEGFATVTRGDNSHAQGHGSVAAGGRSDAVGFNTVAWREGECAESSGAFSDHSPMQSSRLTLAAETTDATPMVMKMGGVIDSSAADLVLTPSTLSAITGTIAARKSDGSLCSMWSIEALVDCGSTPASLNGSAVTLPFVCTVGPQASVTADSAPSLPLTTSGNTFYFNNSQVQKQFQIPSGTYTDLASLEAALESIEGFSDYITVTDNGTNLVFTAVQEIGAAGNGTGYTYSGDSLQEGGGGLAALGFTSGQLFSGGGVGANNTFTYVPNNLDTLPETFTIAEGTYTTLAEVISAVAAATGQNPIYPIGRPGEVILFGAYVTPSDNGAGGILLSIVPGVNGSGGGADNGAVITSTDLGLGAGAFSGGSNSSRIVSQSITQVGGDSGASAWSLALTTSADGCALTATGEAATDIRWVASLSINEVRFGQASVWFIGYDG